VEGAGKAGAAPGGAPQGAGEKEAAEPEMPEEMVEGVCSLEDGTRLPGAEFFQMKEVDGELAPLNGTPRSGLDGSFRVALQDEPYGVRHPDAKLVSADGATRLSLVSDTRLPVHAVSTVRMEARSVRLTFRDNAGTAHVRLVNADTSQPVVDVKGLRLSWFVPGGKLVIGTPEDPGLGGWIPIPEGRLPEVGGGAQAGIDADLSKVEVEFAMPGFEKARLPLRDIHGRTEARVRPVPPDAKGSIEVLDTLPAQVAQNQFIPDPGQEPLTVHFRWMGPDPAPSVDGVLGVPTRPGPFALYGLPDGSWDMEVAATLFTDNTVVRGRKAFDHHGDTVDLGKIVLVPAGRIVLRVVDAAGQPIPQAWAVVVRPEENPDQGRRLDLDESGTVSVGDLEPGIGHRVLVKGLPQVLEQTVTAEANPKAVEFKWTDRLVPCRITLLVDGKAVANPDGRTTIPAVVQDSPLPRDRGAWKQDGTFEARLVPGTYRFSALATPKDGGPLALFAADATVPSGDAFDTRLELQREAR
jgi:hypothetical protein